MLLFPAKHPSFPMPIGKIIRPPKITSFEYISKIRILFSPFTHSSLNARLFTAMLQSKVLRRTNGRTIIDVKVGDDLTHPSVEVEYSNKSKWQFEPHKFSMGGLVNLFEARRKKIAKDDII